MPAWYLQDMKKNYYVYRATVTFSGAVGAVDEIEAIDKIVKDSERLPEMVMFKPKSAERILVRTVILKWKDLTMLLSV